MSATMNRLPALALSLLSLQLGCGADRPQLIDTLQSSTDQNDAEFTPDLRFYAPMVVAASILENKILAHDQPAAREPEILLDLHEVRCRKEADIRGTVPAEFTFYYFSQSPNSPRNNPVYNLLARIDSGRRYVLFLASERGQLRSVGDVGRYYIEILSGAHPGFQRPGPIDRFDRKLGIAIADLLFVMGEGADKEALAEDLSIQVDRVERWGSRLHNLELVTKLLSEPEPVRSAACFVLANNYWGHDDCLSVIADDPNEPQDVHDRAVQLSDRKSSEALRLARFEASQGLEFPIIGRPDSRQALLDELQILLRSSNDKLSAAACTAVRRYFPGETCTSRPAQ